jgi:hypothetical protein
LLKKHEAFSLDLDAYGSVVGGLHDQAQACKVRKTTGVFNEDIYSPFFSPTSYYKMKMN